MKNWFFFATTILVFTSCEFTGGNRIRGNGEIQTETRNAAGFDGIEVSGAIKVFVKQDSVYSVKVEADANLLEYIETKMRDNNLVIRSRNGKNLRPSGSIKVYVSGPSVRQFNASGASSFYGEGRIVANDEIEIDLSGASNADMEIKAPGVSVEVSGASNAKLSGETRDLVVDAAGASKAKCYELLAENAKVDVSGASHAEVFASVELDAKASGASRVKYKGSPAVKGSNTSGAGSVEKAEIPVP